MELRVLRRQRQICFSIKMALDYDKLVFNVVDSTQALSARRINNFKRPTWIFAYKQTDGRGRRGRPWIGCVGNFSATLTLFPKEDFQDQALRTFVASLALYEACVALVGSEVVFSLKWPNDVLLNGGKLAGILLETLKTKAGQPALLIGFGVNLLNTPSRERIEDRAIIPASIFSETGIKYEPEALLDKLMITYANLENQFVNEGFDPIREAWLSRASHLGQEITARLPNEDVLGIFDTIDEKGHLVLQTVEGKKVIAAADVYLEVPNHVACD